MILQQFIRHSCFFNLCYTFLCCLIVDFVHMFFFSFLTSGEYNTVYINDFFPIHIYYIVHLQFFQVPHCITIYTLRYYATIWRFKWFLSTAKGHICNYSLLLKWSVVLNIVHIDILVSVRNIINAHLTSIFVKLPFIFTTSTSLSGIVAYRSSM